MKEKDEKEKKEIISSHIFMFPFKWDYKSERRLEDTCFNDRINLQKFKEGLDISKRWDRDNFSINDDFDYNEFAYFYENVKKAIYTEKNSSDTSWNFKYRNCEGKYVIKIKSKEISYKLDIEFIKLKVYETGIAILSFHLNNHEYKEAKDILKINDYGRRVYPQYIPIEEVQKSFLASEIQLIFNDGNQIIEDFSQDYKNSPYHISSTIMKVLGEKFIYDKEENVSIGKVLIKPVIDDRMYTACWYGNDEIMNKWKGEHNSDVSSNNYYKSEFWHEYIFVDGNGCTCKSKIMLEELLKKHTYDRWIGDGTLYGVTRFSFMVLSNEGWFGKNVIRMHLKRMYYEMASLALAQRASILRFSEEASIDASFKSKETVKKIRTLNKYYIQFINKIYFREVTAQEQGIELYEKITEAMNIERDVSKLDEEIDQLHQYSILASSEKTNKALNVLTYLSALILLPTYITGFFGMNILDSDMMPSITNIKELFAWLGIFTILPILIVLLPIIIIFKKNSKL